MDNFSDKKVALGEVAYEIKNRVANPSESGFERFVGLEHFDSGSLTIKRWGNTSEVSSSMKLFNNGDILFARRNAYLKRASLVNFDGVCSGDAFVIRQIPDIIIENFLSFVLNTEKLWSYAISNASGSMSKRVKWRNLAKYEFYLPSIEEQRRIGNIIWAIENSISQVDDSIIRVQKLKRALMKELLMKGIGHTEFKETPLGPAPLTWKLKRIEEISGISGGSTPSTKNRAYWNGNIPFVTPTDITPLSNLNYINKTKRSITEKALRSNPINLLEPGTILLTSRASIGKGVINSVPLVTNQGFINIMPNLEMYGLWLLYYLRFQKNSLFRIASGSTFKEISRRSFKQMKILVPPLEEQEKIASILVRTDETIVLLEKHKEVSIELKNRVLNDLIK
jgi:type I restriction enzyme, S subunit